MLFATLFLAIMFVGLLIYSVKKQRWSGTGKSLKIGSRMMVGLIPLLVLAFLAAGFLEAAVPPDLIKGWLGASSGVKGYVISWLAGAMLPGGPYVTFPIIGAVYRAGAGLGQVVAMVTAWSTMGIAMVLFELTFLGPRFTVARIALMFWMPVVAGILTHLFF